MYTLALTITYAENLILLGSITNLIVVEQSRIYEINIGFIKHARAAIPVTLTSTILGMIWINIPSW